jgi:electron transfer flavoprotein alpha/beta subunit
MPRAKAKPKAPAKPAAKRAKAKPRAPRRPPKPSVLAAVEKLIDSIELDDFGQARAAIARTLATKFDKAAEPGTAKELRELIDAFQEASDDSSEFVSGLFAPVGDSAST